MVVDLSTLPPNPSACPRVGVWDKPWDKFANYFETGGADDFLDILGRIT